MQLMRSHAAGWMRGIALVVVLLLVLSAFAPARAVSAADTTLNLQILPIDCQFEIIKDGQNTINYITPEECGQVVEPEPEEPNAQPTQPTITQNGSTNTPFFFAVPEEDAPAPSQNQSDDNSAQTVDEPFETLGRLQSLGQTTVDAATSTTSAQVVTAASIVAITDMFLLNSTITTRIKRGAQWLARWWRR